MTDEVVSQAKVLHVNGFSGIKTAIHHMLGEPRVLCIDFFNHDNATLPDLLQHAILIPEGIDPLFKLGDDRSPYTIPINHDLVGIRFESSNVDTVHMVTAVFEISYQNEILVQLPHILCQVKK